MVTQRASENSGVFTPLRYAPVWPHHIRVSCIVSKWASHEYLWRTTMMKPVYIQRSNFLLSKCYRNNHVKKRLHLFESTTWFSAKHTGDWKWMTIYISRFDVLHIRALIHALICLIAVSKRGLWRCLCFYSMQVSSKYFREAPLLHHIQRNMISGCALSLLVWLKTVTFHPQLLHTLSFAWFIILQTLNNYFNISL